MVSFHSSIAAFTIAFLSNSYNANGFTIHSNGLLTPSTWKKTSENVRMSMDAHENNRRDMLSSIVTGGIAATAALTQFSTPAEARLDPVNRPDLLPSEEGLNVIQIEKFLTNGQVKRMNESLTKLEKDTGYRVRVLCQAYPKTPGLAVRDYWDLGKEGQKDDKYIVLVVDQFNGKGMYEYA